MLARLRAMAIEHVSRASRCTLSTVGPAGLQATYVHCQVRDGRLYLQVPKTSDHLFNLEYIQEIVLTAEQWQLHGRARILADVDTDIAPGVLAHHVVVEVTPVQVHIEASDTDPYPLTVDF